MKVFLKAEFNNSVLSRLVDGFSRVPWYIMMMFSAAGVLPDLYKLCMFGWSTAAVKKHNRRHMKSYKQTLSLQIGSQTTLCSLPG